jgi:hypothetical protein
MQREFTITMSVNVGSEQTEQQVRLLVEKEVARALARYLGGLSRWTVKEMVASGILRRVQVPLPSGEDMRRVLIDREQLDRLVDQWRERV